MFHPFSFPVCVNFFLCFVRSDYSLNFLEQSKYCILVFQISFKAPSITKFSICHHYIKIPPKKIEIQQPTSDRV